MKAGVLLLFIILLGVGGYIVYKKDPSILRTFHETSLPLQSVKGVSTTILNPQVQTTLGQLQEEVLHLSPKDISSSSPQVQIILKTLQKLPQGELSGVCQKLCGK